MAKSQVMAACQDVIHTVEKYARTGTDVSFIKEKRVGEICVKSKQGVLKPEEDAKAQLARLIKGEQAECKKDPICIDYQPIGEVRVEEAKSWFAKLKEKLFGTSDDQEGAKPSSHATKSLLYANPFPDNHFRR